MKGDETSVRYAVRTVSVIVLVVSACIFPGGVLGEASAIDTENSSITAYTNDIETDSQHEVVIEFDQSTKVQELEDIMFDYSTVSKQPEIKESLSADDITVYYDNVTMDGGFTTYIEYSDEADFDNIDVKNNRILLNFSQPLEVQDNADLTVYLNEGGDFEDRQNRGNKIINHPEEGVYNVQTHLQTNSKELSTDLSGKEQIEQELSIQDRTVESIHVEAIDLTTKYQSDVNIQAGGSTTEVTVGIDESGDGAVDQSHKNTTVSDNESLVTVGVKNTDIIINSSVGTYTIGSSGNNGLSVGNYITESEAITKIELNGSVIDQELPSEQYISNDTLNISSTLSNTGSTTYTDTLELVVNGSVVDTQSATIEPDETVPVTLSYDTADESPGDDLAVTVRGDHDAVAGTVEIVEPPENRVRLENETASYEAGSTDTPTIAGNVTNEGGANATDPYDLSLDVANGSIRKERSDRPALDAGESAAFSFDLDAETLSNLDVGTHPITVTESFTNDAVEGSLTITENESGEEDVGDAETDEEEEDSITTQESTESGDETEIESGIVGTEDPDSGSSSGSTAGGGGGGSTFGGGGSTGPEPASEPDERIPPPVRGYVGDGDVALAEPILTVGRGDVAPITVNRDDVAAGGALVIGNDSAMEYGAAIHVETFGEAESITVLFNTYTAGTTAGPVVELDTASLEAGASIGFDPERDQTGPTGRIGTGEYSLVASTAPHPETAERNPSDVGVLVIEPRGNAEATTWTTSRRTAETIREAVDPAAAMAAGARDGTVTRRDRIAHGDVAILEVRATGLSGLLALAGRERGTRNATKRLRTVTDPGWSGTETEGNAAIDHDGSRAAVELDIGETPESAGVRGERRTVDVGADGISAATAGDRDRVYLLVDTTRFAFEDGTSVDPADSATFRLDVHVPAARPSHAETMAVPGTIGGVGRPGGGASRGNERFERPANAMQTVSKRSGTEVEGSSTPAFAIDRRSATTTFSVVERDVEFREDPYDVRAAPGRTFEGETSIAPGTPITVDVRPESGTEATLEPVASDAVVAADGSWSAGIDLSTGSAGDRYRVHVRRAGVREERASVRGTILGIEPEPTAEPMGEGDHSEDGRERSTTAVPGTTPNAETDPAGAITAGAEAVHGRVDPETLLSVLVLLLFLVGLYRGRTM